MPKFVLPNAESGQTIIAGRYAFVDGEMPVSKGEALKLERILCRFHGCELVYENEQAVEQTEAENSSLAVDVTKAGAEVKVEQPTEPKVAEPKAAETKAKA